MCASPSPLTITPVPYFASAVLAHARPAVEANIKRRAFSAPEVREYPDDIFYEWADTLIDDMGPVIRDFIQYGAKDDMENLLAFFCDESQTWPAHRRAFFNRLYKYSVQLEKDGCGEASQAFADFIRERYMPPYFFIAERRAAPQVFAPATAAAAREPSRTPSPTTPSSALGAPLETIQEVSRDDEEVAN